ncbi:MAG: hypothetical protein M0Q70_04705 [Dokdonella sp.]|nr:hypothetical protein [Dokdonella sp.]
MVIANPYHKPPLHILLGTTILVASLWPLDRWLRSTDLSKIPVFELHLAFFAICFGLAAYIDPLRRVSRLLGVDEHSYTVGLLAVIVAIAFEFIGYGLASRFRGNLLARMAPRFPVRADSIAILCVYPAAVVVSVATKYYQITALDQVVPSVRLFAFTWALCAAWSGSITRPLRWYVLLTIAPIEILLFGNFLLSGALYGLLSYGELIMVCYAVCRRRVLWQIALVGVVALLVLQPVKGKFRDVIWKEGSSTSVQERLDLVADEAFAAAIDATRDGSLDDQLQNAYGRLNHLATTSAIILTTSREDRFEYGRTYLPILTKWIPRGIWPEKPTEDLGNRWGREYGFVASDDYATSYNLPWLPEMYMNFGWTGVCGLSLCIGFLIGLLKKGILDRVKSPVEVAFGITLASVFFFPESNLSLTFGGVIITWISVSIALFLIRVMRRMQVNLGGAV